MARIKLYLDKRSPRKDGTCPVKIAVNSNSQTAFVGTCIHVLPKNWDREKTKVIGQADRNALNETLSELQLQYTHALQRLRLEGTLKNKSAKEVRDAINKMLYPDEQKEKIRLRDVFEEYRGKCVSQSTDKRFGLAWTLIAQFCGNDAEALGLDDVNLRFAENFRKWLTDGGRKVNTVSLMLRTLHTVVHYAVDAEYIEHDPLVKLKLKHEQTRKRCLQIEDLRGVLQYHSSKEFADDSFDIFRITFLLIGINFSDLVKLRPSDLHDGRIEYRRNKTGKLYSIKVEPELLQYIDKYRGSEHLFSFKKGLHQANQDLKEFREDLSTYWARHSWATTAAELEIPKDTIAAALGHGGNTVTDIYISFDRKKVDDANRKVIDWVFYGKR